MVLVSMGLWEWWSRYREYDVWWVANIIKILNNDLNKKLDVVYETRSPRGISLPYEYWQRANPNILISGGSREGKTTLSELLCVRLEERKIVFSFKKFSRHDKRDFDIGYNWIEVGQKIVPDLFADYQSFIDSFRTAFYTDATSRGLAIDTILLKINDIMNEKPTDFEAFFKILDKLSGRGNWDETIKNIIRSKVQLLQRATAGARQVKIDFSKGNMVIDLGTLPEEESKTFIAETILRQIFRIEEVEHRENHIRIVIDEAWHLLGDKRQKSIVGTLLLQGAYVINLMLILQNYTMLDKDFRSHFGNIFVFKNNNDDDANAIKSGYGDFVKDAVQKLPDFEFIDLKFQFNAERIPVWKVNYENLQTLKLEARARTVFNEPDESFVEEEPQENKTDEKKNENLEEKIIEALQKSEVAMYGYQIAKAVGLSPKDAVKIRQPLRNLVRDGKIKEIEIQVRKKVVVYYYLSETETGHNFMMQVSEKEIVKSGWKIGFKSTHGTHGFDFQILDKDGRGIIIEVDRDTQYIK